MAASEIGQEKVLSEEIELKGIYKDGSQKQRQSISTQRHFV